MSRPLICCQELSKAYGSQVLFKELSLSVFARDKMGLIGPNGAGKSSLVKILMGKEPETSGTVIIKKGLRIGYVPQVTHFTKASITDVLRASFPKEHHYSQHEVEVIIQQWITKLGFKDPEQMATELSGGWKKRLSIAIALLNDPDVIIFDEPTNHLDLDGAIWLEDFLKTQVKTFILVSHDRQLLEGACNRIVEINRAFTEGLLSIQGSYANFLLKKQEALDGQVSREKSLASKLRREKEWLKSTPKARTTKSRSRIDEAYELMDEHASLKVHNQTRQVAIDFVSSERQTRKLITLKSVKKSIGERTLFEGLDLLITSKMRLGLMGANGSGKSTLMKILMQELSPDSGTIKFAEGLKCVYFDQEKAKLNEKLTLKEALSPSGDFVNYRGQSIHVNGWCKRFLFSPDALEMPISKLSGGERARLSIAKLMLEPADVLLLDEPTNDLDIPTLETLEASLNDFPGAVILITHDRAMLSNICTEFLALGDKTPELFASYEQWAEGKGKKEKKAPKKEVSKDDWENRKARSRIEKKIEKEEEALDKLKKRLASTEAFDALESLCKDIEAKQSLIDTLYEDWDALNQIIES